MLKLVFVDVNSAMYINHLLNCSIVEILNVLKNDGVIAFPTDTVWGLGCNPDSKTAVLKIYNLKSRDAKKPLILMSSKLFIVNLSEWLPPTKKIFKC